MVQVSRLFRASFSAAVLQGAALAIALIVPASPARSETIDLACVPAGETKRPLGRIQIDTDHRTALVDEAQYAVSVISDQFITLEVSYPNNGSRTVTVDRIAGTAQLTRVLENGGFFYRDSYACRRATKKF